jgi:hypothetical protein
MGRRTCRPLLESIEVTDSLIHTTNRVNFNQVQFITQSEIAASGAITAAAYLRATADRSASSTDIPIE